MKRMKLISAFALLLTLSACGPNLKPFTQRLYNEGQWTDGELKRIQFYLSENIVMRRKISSGTSEIIRGEIKIVDGQEMEEIIIEKGTPGVLLFKPKDRRFAISFEDGGDERFLIFGPNPKYGNRYALLASDWSRRSGTVSYDGRRYQVSSASAYASLLVDLKKISNVKVKSRRAEGRRVN